MITPIRRPKPPKIAAVLLAAGQSSRFGGDKRLVSVDPKNPNSESLLKRSIKNLLPQVDQLVVTIKMTDQGRELELLGEFASSSNVKVVYSEKSAEGLSGSLHDGVVGLDVSGFDGVVIALADMPFVQPATIRVLLEHCQCSKIVRPGHRSKKDSSVKPGHPVLFGRDWFTQLLCCEGDAGARHLLKANPEAVVLVEVDDPGVLHDIDRPGDLGE